MRKFSDLFYGRDKAVFETSESFGLLFRTYAITGVRLVRPYRMHNFLYSAFCWALIITSPLYFAVGMARLVKTATVTETLTNVQASINVLALPFKTLVITFYTKRFSSTEPIFKHLDDRYNAPKQREQIKASVQYCTRLFSTYCMTYFGFGLLTFFSGLVTHTQPIYAWYPFIDWIQNHTLRFWLHFGFETIFVLYLLLIQVCNDGYPGMYMHALRTHMNLLVERVSRLATNSEFDDEQNFMELVDCIASHQELIQIAKIVGSVISLTIFIQFIVTAAILCVCMLNIFIFADTYQKVVGVSYYVCVLLQTVPTCYEASMLEFESSQLPLALFHCNWLALDKRSRKLLIYFMHNAQQEISFTALKFFQINLRTNLAITKFSLTLYAFMKNVGLGENFKDKK